MCKFCHLKGLCYRASYTCLWWIFLQAGSELPNTHKTWKLQAGLFPNIYPRIHAKTSGLHSKSEVFFWWSYRERQQHLTSKGPAQVACIPQVSHKETAVFAETKFGTLRLKHREKCCWWIDGQSFSLVHHFIYNDHFFRNEKNVNNYYLPIHSRKRQAKTDDLQSSFSPLIEFHEGPSYRSLLFLVEINYGLELARIYTPT